MIWRQGNSRMGWMLFLLLKTLLWFLLLSRAKTCNLGYTAIIALLLLFFRLSLSTVNRKYEENTEKLNWVREIKTVFFLMAFAGLIL
jgi:uncharacterized membrane protein